MTEINRLFDTHCHFDFDTFAADFPEHLLEARRHGVERFMIPSIGAQNWHRVAYLAQGYPAQIYYALGLHPCFLHKESEQDILRLERQLSQAEAGCVALGECGLDGRIDVPAELQERVFVTQIEIARQARLPMILHSRKTHHRLLALIKQHKFQYGGVLHAFSGSVQQAQQFIDLGFKIGVGGVITYPRAKKTRQTVSQLPITSLVLETDAPDMPLCGHQGQDNHPKRLSEILTVLARLRQTMPCPLAKSLWQNSHQLFNLEVVDTHQPHSV